MNTETNRMEALANILLDEDRFEELEAELAKFDPADFPAHEQETWYHLWGVAAYKRGDHETALTRFQEGLEKFPQSGQIAFSLGQEYEHIAEIPAMLALFDQFTYPAVPGNFALAQARYAYLWGWSDRGIDYIRPIVDQYFELGVADDTFLHMHGLPLFGQTWATLGALYELSGGFLDFIELTQYAAEHLTQYDFAQMLKFAAAVQRDDYQGFAAYLGDMIMQYRKKRWPSAYLQMRLALLSLHTGVALADSERLVNAVRIGRRDFGWLGDMRLLAQTIIAGRRGEVEHQEELIDSFMSKQTLLFEPEHAFNFRVLDYQEDLKLKYQRARREHL